MRNRRFGKAIAWFAAVSLVGVIHLAGTAVAEDSATSYLKDILIRQKPMADLIVHKATVESGTAPQKSKLEVVASLDRRDATYQQGDELTLNVKANEDCYVWVFDTGTSGAVVQIYPNKHDQKNFLAAGKTLSIPGKGAKYRLQVAPPSGVELITVVASKENLPLTEKLVDKFVPGTPFAALRGNAETVSKDLIVTMRRQGEPGDKWATGQVAFRVK